MSYVTHYQVIKKEEKVLLGVQNDPDEKRKD